MSIETDNGAEFTPSTALVAPHSLGKRLSSWVRLLGRSLKKELWVHVAQLPLGGLSMAVPASRMEAQSQGNSKRPVVFVHGLGGHPGNFSALELKLRVAGMGQLYRVDLRDTASMVTGAASLTSSIDRVLEVNGFDENGQIDLVAHSMGGVLSRVAMLSPKLKTRVRRLITLGTPHHGSHLAWYLTRYVGAGAELSPESPIWTDLSAQEPWDSSTKLTSFYTSKDCLVRPSTSCFVRGADNRERSEETHFSFLWSPSVFSEIFTILQRE